MCTHEPSNRGGFSLVEVLVALAVLTFGILGALELYTSSRTVTHRALVRAKAVAAARAVAETWRAAGPAALGDVYRREASAPASEVLHPHSPVLLDETGTTWQARLAPVVDHPGLLEVRVAVAWGDDAANPLAATPAQSVQHVEWLPIQP